MQQDRSTGWRLGTNRIVQFRYQVIGIAMGAVLAVVLAKIFMNSYRRCCAWTSSATRNAEGAQQWQSAMTYKFVGALKGITNPQPHVMKALRLGIALGLLIEIARKLIKRSRRYQQAVKTSRAGRAADFVLDAVCCPALTPRRSAGLWSCPRCSGGRRAGWGRRCSTLVQARRAARRPQACGRASCPRT